MNRWMRQGVVFGCVCYLVIAGGPRLVDAFGIRVEGPGEPVAVQNWAELADVGVPETTGGATTDTMVVFVDFECPSCRDFAVGTELELDTAVGDRLLVLTRHSPLPSHEHAESAAVAYECAAEQGSAVAMYRMLFDLQDEIGSTPYEQLAERAGVADLQAFATCLSTEEPLRRVRADARMARAAGVEATPAVILNGMRYPRLPSADEILGALESTSGSSGRRAAPDREE